MIFFRKKYYREVPCKACDETGKIYFSRRPNPYNNKETIREFRVCESCNGKGTQTVLEKVE